MRYSLFCLLLGLLMTACEPETIDVASEGAITYTFAESRTFACEESYDVDGIILTLTGDTLDGCGYSTRLNPPTCRAGITDSLSTFGLRFFVGSALKIDLSQLRNYNRVILEVGNDCGEGPCLAIGLFDGRGQQLSTTPLRPRNGIYTFRAEDLDAEFAYFLVPGCETYLRQILIE